MRAGPATPTACLSSSGAIAGCGAAGPDSERLVALHGDALHATAIRVVVVRGVVLRGAVVPEGDRAGLPAQAELVLGDVRLLEQHVEKRAALVLAQSLD